MSVCAGKHGGVECQSERVAPSVHLSTEAGGVRSDVGHGVRDAVSRAAHASHLRNRLDELF